MDAKKSKRYLKLKQLSEEKIVPWSHKTTERLCKSGEIPYIDLPGGWVVDLDDVIAYMSKHKQFGGVA